MDKTFMTNLELIDSLIVDLNTGIKMLLTGDYVSWNAINLKMFQKLTNLKKGVSSDMKNREEIIDDLKQQLRQAGVDVEDIPISQLKGVTNDG